MPLIFISVLPGPTPIPGRRRQQTMTGEVSEYAVVAVESASSAAAFTKVPVAATGAVKSIGAVNTFSHNLNGSRGRQNFVLYGSALASDPGWNVMDAKRFTPIAAVDVPADALAVYVGTRIGGNGGKPLGPYRWLIWRVFTAASAVGENTAFQEFQVLAP